MSGGWTVEPGTAVAVGLEILIMDDGTTKRWGFLIFKKYL
jgi:hypothetical protein